MPAARRAARSPARRRSSRRAAAGGPDPSRPRRTSRPSRSTRAACRRNGGTSFCQYVSSEMQITPHSSSFTLPIALRAPQREHGQHQHQSARDQLDREIGPVAAQPHPCRVDDDESGRHRDARIDAQPSWDGHRRSALRRSRLARVCVVRSTRASLVTTRALVRVDQRVGIVEVAAAHPDLHAVHLRLRRIGDTAQTLARRREADRSDERGVSHDRRRRLGLRPRSMSRSSCACSRIPAAWESSRRRKGAGENRAWAPAWPPPQLACRRAARPRT